METEVIMLRELFGSRISQRSRSGMFSATDLFRAGNAWRVRNGLSPADMKGYFNRKSTQEFMAELEERYGKVKVAARGRGKHTWVHPLLFIDMALAISPKLKIEVYEWLFDNLIKYRNDSGDSYKEACAALYTRCTNHREFPEFIKRAARYIRTELAVKDWQTATEEQLMRRDGIHKAIKLYARVLTNPYDIVRLAVEEYRAES